MKTCYTVILGGYDQLRNPTLITPGWSYVCITDTPEICEGTVYEPFTLKKSLTPKTIRNRNWKWSYPNISKDDILIYHDGNFQVIGNLDEFIKPLNGSGFATREHPSRTNLLEEAQACYDLGKIDASTAAWVAEQVADMDQLPPGLWENGLLYFEKSGLDIWDEHFWHLAQMLPLCHRDQIILPMVLNGEIEPRNIDRQRAEEFFKYHVTHLK